MVSEIPDVDPFAELPDEFRLDAEAAEADALMAMRRGRSLVDVATDLAHRGRTVDVVVGERQLRGDACGAGDGVLLLDVAGDRVGVNLAAVRSLGDLGPAARVGVIERPGSWRAWLVGLEARAGVEVGMTSDASLIPMAILAVARDHLLVRTTAEEAAIALDHVSVVVVRGQQP